MNGLVKEWIIKAEGDYNSAMREYRARISPNYDAAGFHAQQCIEKYLKALLQVKKVPFLKTHDLLTLSGSVKIQFPEIEAYKKQLAYLNQFAVLFRYPGESADKEKAKYAIGAMKMMRELIRKKMHLSITR